MRVNSSVFLIAMTLITLLFPKGVYGADAATVVFKSGQVVQIDDGFRQLVEAMKGLNGESTKHRIVELNIGGGTFLLNVSEVVILCRDKCSSASILHQLDPKRGGSSTNINLRPGSSMDRQ